MALSPTTARTTLITIRGILTLGWFAPVPMAKVFGLGRAADTDVALPFLVRLFAVRDGALAVLTVLAPRDKQRTTLAIGVAVDATDVVAGLLSLKDRRLPRRTGLMTSLTATSAVVLGLLAMRAD
jgi:hypothetical protein